MNQVTAIAELRERYARGGVALEDFRRLMGELLITTDPSACQAIIDQLPPEPDFDPFTRPDTVTPARASQTHRITAFFAEVDRSDTLWELGPRTDVRATFGEVRLDVRMASLTPGENVLNLHATFGEIRVIIPSGLRVHVEGSVRFGEILVPGYTNSGITGHQSTTFGSASTGSWLRINAAATFGEVVIRER